ncbi:MAG TPA: FAD-dependent monooxygenase [Acidimicrobiales bacterium]|nr:FAD-dependent monooxygenase [Acidimicrobiales bacterium]
MTTSERRQALVVGAGPVGLSCALALHARGVEVAVLEAESGDEPRPGSRAIYVHRASLELLEAAHPGLGSRIADQGVVWPAKQTFWRGREVFARSYPPAPSDGLPPFASLPQTVIERELALACARDGVEVVRGAQVATVAANAGAVEVRTAGGASLTTDYVVGADGARSAVRAAIGVPLEGSRSENAFVVVDVLEDPEHPTPPARIFHYRHPALGGRNVLLVPFAGGWRADLQCRAGDDPERFAGAEGVRAWIELVLGPRYADRIAWVSTYRFLQVVARTFADEHRRVLLVGDAAHLFAPFGARGMNSGIADATEAASEIDAALGAAGGDAARAAVDVFAAERHAAAIRNREAAGLALAAMQSRRPGMWAKRRAAAVLAPYSERAGRWLDAAPYGPRLRQGRGRRGSGY